MKKYISLILLISTTIGIMYMLFIKLIKKNTNLVNIYVRCLDMNGNLIRTDYYYGTYISGTVLKMIDAPAISGYTPKEKYKKIKVQEDNNILEFIYKLDSYLYREDSPMPILEYHCVGEPEAYDINALFYVSVEDFRSQMKYLKSNGYKFLDFSQLENYYEYEKPIMITFDDGYENNFKNALPILKEYSIKSTIFLVSSKINAKNFLTEDQIKEMVKSNLISFQGHTVSHGNLTTMNSEQIRNEFIKSNMKIEELTGNKVEVLSYPYGEFSDKVINEIHKNNHYKYCVASGNRPYVYCEEPKSKFMIPRIIIKRNDTFEDFVNKIEEY